jgi:hypothetical protein
MSKKPERINQLYQNDNQMKWLSIRAQKLNKLNTILQKSLPLKFSNHCTLANITEDKIVILTDKANYASLLRFQAAFICSTLSAHLPKPIKKLEVKVRPKSEPLKQKTLPNTLRVSAKTADLLESTAAEMQDGPLKAALNKLAKRQTKQNN